MGQRVSGGGEGFENPRPEGHWLILGTEQKLECFRSRGWGEGHWHIMKL